jgi:D-beta-D-heptose 7-phosphate kinase/D-beta-D-heptose 1-phosphate adenosyltransferase
MAELSLADWLDRLAGRRIVVIGDVMLDEYLWGDATRLSAEAPVPVVEVRERTGAAGGAANAAANVAGLGGTAYLGGVVGVDANGRRLLGILREAGIDGAGLVRDPARPTTAKVRVLACGQQIVRVDHEVRTPPSAGIETRLLRWAEAELGRADGCILSDYGKGVVTPRLALAVIGLARGRGLPVVVDPKGTDYTRYRGATVIKPNVAEVKDVLRDELAEPTELERAGRRLVELLHGTAVLITRGADGMTLVEEGAPVRHVPAAAAPVYDATGAGDTVVAAVALALAAGAGLETATRLANHAAGLAVAKRGTSAVNASELRSMLDDGIRCHGRTNGAVRGVQAVGIRGL